MTPFTGKLNMQVGTVLKSRRLNFFLRISFSIAGILLVHLSAAWAQDLVIDSVVASVDGKPITLADVESRLKNKRSIAPGDIAKDEEARQVLDFLISEKILILEAESKKLNVSDAEVEDYINEVAKRNGMSRQAFESALAQEGKTLEDYKRFLKVDILKSKISSQYVKSNVSVSQSEIEKYMEEHPEYLKSGDKVKLSQIVIRIDDMRSEGEALAVMQNIRAALDSGKDFTEMAVKYSEASEAKEGGSLGILPLEDLSQEIAEATANLEKGEVSEITRTPVGLHIFKIDARLKAHDEDDNESIKEEIRKILLEDKIKEKMASFFTTDIYKLHTVDRKI